VTNATLVRRSLVVVALILALALSAVATAKTGKGDTVDVLGGKSVLALDIDTFEALSSYGVTASVIEGADENGKGLSFPISGGKVKAPGFTGTIEHTGGLEFTNSSTGVDMPLRNFVVKLGKDKAKLFVTLADGQFRFATLDPSHATVSVSQGGDLKIKNLGASLAKPGAEVLSDLAGTRIDKGTPLGLLKVKAQIPGHHNCPFGC
jgi:hypothetical protein